MNNESTLGKLIAAARKKAGLKQVELSTTLGYPYNVLTKWENGQARPTRREFEQLVMLLGPELVSAASPKLLAAGLVPDPQGGKEPGSRPSRIEEGIAQRLHHLRTSAGYTARYVCEQTGIQPPQYTLMEQGGANPTYKQLRELKHLYHTSYDYLLDGINTSR